MLTYNRSDHLEVIGYCDSNYGGCLDDYKSISGYMFMLVGGAISWENVKQTLIATSTMEAKYITCYEATRQEISLKNFISKFCLVESISRSLPIYRDNSTVVCFSQNNKTSKRSKHFDTKFMFVREKIKSSKLVSSVTP